MRKCGIDIGGTTVKGALFNNDSIVRTATRPTFGSQGRDAILKQVFSLLDELIDDDTHFIGISSAGNIDPATGICVYATDNLKGWTGTPIRALVEDRYKRKTLADNDAVCALLGELRFYPDVRNITMLTLGTGVGGASLQDGKILRGTHFDAARWGHVCIVPDGLPCNCGKRGCAESYLSATALLKAVRQQIPEVKDCEELFAMYRAGNASSKNVLWNFGKNLCLLLDTVRAVLAPDHIILGGGVARSEDVIKELLQGKDKDVRFAELGDMAGVYGAAGLAENIL